MSDEDTDCPSGKIRYPDWEQAAWALQDVRAAPRAWSREKIPVRVYECPRCGGWHLTSMPLGSAAD